MMRYVPLAVVLMVACAQAQAQQAIPELELDYPDGGSTNSHSLVGARGTVFIFWSNECNWTQQYQRRVMAVARSANDVSIVLVNANDARAFPSEAKGNAMELPYVRDSQGALARALGAERTPHVFAFNATKQLVYSGAIDDAAAEPDAVEHAWLEEVVIQLGAGESVTVPETRPFGCRIKLP